MIISLRRYLWAICLVLASSIPAWAAQEIGTVQRLSAFYFAEELSQSPDKVTSQSESLMGLHASAIRIGGSSRSIWINGRELKIGDRIGPVEIVDIKPTSADLRLRDVHGTPKNLQLALNQFIVLPAFVRNVAEQNVPIREGLGKLDPRRRLPQVRLP